MSRTKAIHIKQWADELDARGKLPLLVRRLVRRTCPSATIDFPAEEQTRRPGFDGIVSVSQGTQYVPTGNSVWEMGVDSDPKVKASSDFDARTRGKKATPVTKQQDTVFVFVTPRVWDRNLRTEWINEAKNNSRWKDIVVLDCNDLEHWLELVPSVDHWVTRCIGRVPVDGVEELSNHWENLRAISNPVLTPSVFTTSRDEAVEKLESFLGEEANSFHVRTLGYNDGIDFLSALQASRSRDDESYLENCLIVSTSAAWGELCHSREPLVLVTNLPLSNTEIASAVRAGHHAVLVAPRAISRDRDSYYELPRQDYHDVSKALEESGFDVPRARAIGRASHGSSSILKRLLPDHPSGLFPDWASDENKHNLAPYALVGGWVNISPSNATPKFGSGPPIDVDIATEISGHSESQQNEVVNLWSQTHEPLFVQFGNSVLLVSREDAWYLLGGSLTAEQLNRFRDLAVFVLSEDDPALEMPQEDRWTANIFNKVRASSGELQRGLVESLVLMNTYGTVDPPRANVDFVATVRSVLYEVLPADCNWQRWASLGRSLSTLAEADPDYFLNCVETDLASGDPELPKLFQDNTHSIFGGAIHSDLLWALETLCWSPDWLPRASLALARLARFDPGGTYSNRPANSLTDVFLTWLPHTKATTNQCLAVLRQVLEWEPDAGWALLKSLLPCSGSSTTSGTRMPRWRDWANGWTRRVYSDYATQVAGLAIDFAAYDCAKWSEIISGIFYVDGPTTERAIAALEALAAERPNEQERTPLWATIRQTLIDQQEKSEAELFQRLTTVRDAIEPIDPILKHAWLFGNGADLAYLRDNSPTNWHEALTADRIQALRLICEQTGTAGIDQLLQMTDGVGALGWLLGANKLITAQDIRFRERLNSNSPNMLDFARSYASGAFHALSFEFLVDLRMETWTKNEIAALATCFPFNDRTWSWLDQFDPGVTAEYWNTVRPQPWSLSEAEFAKAISALLTVGRGLDAIDTLYGEVRSNGIEIGTDAIADVLESAAILNVQDGSGGRNIRHKLQELIKKLQEDETFPEVRLATLELTYLGIFDSASFRTHGDARPTALMKAVWKDPDFFIQLVVAAYKAEGEHSTTPTEEQRLLARRSYNVLERIDQLPKTESGEIDTEAFTAWVGEVRQKLEALDRHRVTDLLIGQIIARSTYSKSEAWPQFDFASCVQQLATEKLINGFVAQVFNLRGVSSRGLTDGGVQERELAERYKKLADRIRPFSVKLAGAFTQLSVGYLREANREDEEAKRVRWGQ